MPLLVAAVNLSEGRDLSLLDEIADAAGTRLLDRHADPEHNRAVLTVLVDDGAAALGALVAAAFARLRLGGHTGVHPRLGVVDVVPFTPLIPDGPLQVLAEAPLTEAIRARDAFAAEIAATFAVPCFTYGPRANGDERSLPEIRRQAFSHLAPDYGPSTPHLDLGAVCVGARRALVAYNVVLASHDLALGRRIAAALRSRERRVLAFSLSAGVQISFNLVAPWLVGPVDAYDAVAAAAATEGTAIKSAELVGLLPAAVLAAAPAGRHRALGLDADATIEARLARWPNRHPSDASQRPVG